MAYTPPPFRDVNNDFRISLADLSQVINRLIANSRLSGGEGESVTATASATAAPVTAVIASVTEQVLVAPVVANSTSAFTTQTVIANNPVIQPVNNFVPMVPVQEPPRSEEALLDSALAGFGDDDDDFGLTGEGEVNGSVFDAALIDLAELPNKKKS